MQEERQPSDGQRVAALARNLTRRSIVERSIALCSEVAIRRLSFARHARRNQGCSALQQAGVVHGHVQHPVCQRGAQGIAQAGLAHTGHRVAVAVGQQRIAALQHQVWVQ